MDQIDPKGMLPDFREQRDGIFLKYLGDSSCLEVTAQEYTHKKQKQPGHQGVIIAGTVTCAEAKDEKREVMSHLRQGQGKYSGDAPNSSIKIPGGDQKKNAHKKSRNGGDSPNGLIKKSVEEHGCAEEMKDAEGDLLRGHNKGGNTGDDHAPEQGFKTPLQIASGKAAGYACQDHKAAYKAVTEIGHGSAAEKDILPTEYLAEIKENVVANHKKNADAPDQIQQVIPYFLFHEAHLLKVFYHIFFCFESMYLVLCLARCLERC